MSGTIPAERPGCVAGGGAGRAFDGAAFELAIDATRRAAGKNLQDGPWLSVLPAGGEAGAGTRRCHERAGIEVEVWAVPEERFGSFVALIPPPLAIGTATLDDGSAVKCFLCEPYAIAGAKEITELGGWRKYLELSA